MEVEKLEMGPGERMKKRGCKGQGWGGKLNIPDLKMKGETLGTEWGKLGWRQGEEGTGPGWSEKTKSI